MNNAKSTSMLMLLGGNIFSIIGCFLPFLTVFGFSVSYIKGDGVFVVILCAVSILLAFIKTKFAFIANILALIVTFVAIFQAADFSLEILGAGAYIIVIANIVAIIGGLKARKA